MSSVKVKFRPSAVEGRQGVICYQIIRDRKVRRIKTDYCIFGQEWDSATASFRYDASFRPEYLRGLEKRIGWEVRHLSDLLRQGSAREPRYTVEEALRIFKDDSSRNSVFRFMRELIVQLRDMGRLRTSETYEVTLRSFAAFRRQQDLLFEELDSDMMRMYEAYLRNRGLVKNTTSFYMRILRAVYNRAVEKNLVGQQHPFRHVYTGVDKTVKRALPLRAIRKIKELDLKDDPRLDLARDMFLFSFYTRGMSFVDMAYLRKKDLSGGILTYRRRKTGQRLSIRWERCMEQLVCKYDTRRSEYLLPILGPSSDTPTQYRNMMSLINLRLKKIAALVGLDVPLTLYVARHSWASAARSRNIPISVISEGMGHDSEQTTQIYLASLDTATVDRANARILKEL